MKKTAEEIIDELIEAIEPLKVKPAKRKAEQFVNVGIEAVKRLLIGNKTQFINAIDQQWTSASNPPDTDRWVRVLVERNGMPGRHDISPRWYSSKTGKWYEYGSAIIPVNKTTHWADFEDLKG